MNIKLWLSSPHMGGTEQKYVQEAFDTNWVESDELFHKSDYFF